MSHSLEKSTFTDSRTGETDKMGEVGTRPKMYEQGVNKVERNKKEVEVFDV